MNLYRSDKTKERGFRLLGAANQKGKYMSEKNGRVVLARFVMQIPLVPSVWAEKSLGLSLVIKNHPAFPSREEEGREFFLCLLPLNYFQLKIILMSKQHILEWHTLQPLTFIQEIFIKHLLYTSHIAQDLGSYGVCILAGVA